MNRFKPIFLFLLLVGLISLGSCTGKEDILSYQSYPMEAGGRLITDSAVFEIKVNVYSPQSLCIAVTTPEALKGYSFRIDNDEMWVYYEDAGVKLPSVAQLPARCIASMLTLSPDKLLYTRNDELGSTAFFEEETAEISLHFRNREAYPYLIKHSGGEKLSFEIDYIMTP